MAHSTLVNIPLEIRERIYQNLLTRTHDPSSTPGPKAVPASPLCALLTLNRHIHAEILSFLKSQLLVLFKTNNARFVINTLKDQGGETGPFAFVSQLRSADWSTQKSTANAPIAMELEHYYLGVEGDVDSLAAFLVPASKLKTMVDAQSGSNLSE